MLPRRGRTPRRQGLSHLLPRRRIELQITEIGVPGDGEHEAAPSREERVKRRYGESGGHEEGGGNVDAGERHITKRAYEAA